LTATSAATERAVELLLLLIPVLDEVKVGAAGLVVEEGATKADATIEEAAAARKKKKVLRSRSLIVCSLL
jgi:hypothetical protein